MYLNSKRPFQRQTGMGFVSYPLIILLQLYVEGEFDLQSLVTDISVRFDVIFSRVSQFAQLAYLI